MLFYCPLVFRIILNTETTSLSKWIMAYSEQDVLMELEEEKIK